jgi:hypothetical protein
MISPCLAWGLKKIRNEERAVGKARGMSCFAHCYLLIIHLPCGMDAAVSTALADERAAFV